MAPVAVGVSLLLVIACAYGQSCPDGNADISEADRQSMVNKHNEFRSITAKGQAVNADGTTLPSGKNIFKLSWDCTLEKEAQAVAEANAANGCQMEHKKPNPFGENIAEGYGTKGAAGYTGKVFPESATMWYGELKKPGYYNSLSSYVFSSGIGHWSAVVWGKVKRIGCGVAKCDSGSDFNTGAEIWTKSITVCQYWPSPNYKSQPIYEQGNPCQQDSDCPASSTCSASDGLCVDASANAQTQLPSAASILAFVKPKFDFNAPGVKGVLNSFGSSGTVATYGTFDGCVETGCKFPNGLDGTCNTSTQKCTDPNWLKGSCWAC